MNQFSGATNLERGREIAARVEAFVRERIIPFERDSRQGEHGPSDQLVAELRNMARSANLLTPIILDDDSHLSHAETALVLRAGNCHSLCGQASGLRAHTR
jgi:acyl-CoA dehydrogenase